MEISGINSNFATKLYIILVMAYYIKPIPTLTGEVAQRFNERAAEAEEKRGSIDFTDKVEAMRAMLREAKLGY